MIIFQVDAWFSAMEHEDIKQELKVVGEVFAALDCGLVAAEVGEGHLLAYVSAESELVVADVFEASLFNAERIASLGWSHEARIDVDRPAGLGRWRYRPAPDLEPRQAGQCCPQGRGLG